MMSKNKKGFTLVEVLAVIVILGILSTIGIVTVVNIRKSQEEKFDQTQRELFRQTAKTYFSDNKSQLPSVPGSTNTIYLDDLIKENYLDSLLDYNKNNYDLDSSVKVTKVGENQYFYTVSLHKEGSKEDITDMTDTDSDKGIDFDNYRKDTQDTTDKIGYDKNENIYYTNKTVKIDLEIKDEQGIMAFAYILYKNNVRVYTSEYISGNNTTELLSDTLVIDTNNHGDGTYQIEVLVYDSKDHVKSKKSDKIIIDRIAPICKTKKNPNVVWTNKDTTISGICKDNQGKNNGTSGCVKRSVRKNFEKEGQYNKSPGIVEDKAGNKTVCEKVSVNIDKTVPIVSLSATTQDPYSRYNTINANIVVNIIDTNATKYGLSTSGYLDKDYNQLENDGSNKNISMHLSDTYDGSTKTVYVTVSDIAGNTVNASTNYTVYKNCTTTTITGTSYGNCSATCGSGTRTQTQTTKDTYLGTACSPINTTVSCGTLPSCCTGPTTTYTAWSTCSKKCTRDGKVGTKTRKKTVTQCDGTSVTTTEKQNCNTQECCSSVTLSSCSASCGVGVKTATSNYDGGSCSSKNETCQDRTCSKSTCYVGNTLYSVNVHWPYNTGKVGNGNCPDDTEAYWFYCSDEDGKLWTNLQRNGFYSGHAQWACKSNKLGSKVGKTVTINGSKYKVINDSGSFWEKCSNECYHKTCS